MEVIRRVYLAGPMRGLPEYNFPAFHAAALELRARGLEVWSPAEKDEVDGFNPKSDEAAPLREYMKVDLPAVLDCDAIAVLPGWRNSTGAKLEVHVAQACDIPVLEASTLEPIHESVTAEADRLVSEDRGAVYGHPLDDFSRTARLWTVLFDFPFQAEDVAVAMRMVKESRLRKSPRHRDSLVDIAGYAKTQAMCWEERARRDRAA